MDENILEKPTVLGRFAKNKVDDFIANPKKALFVLSWPLLIGILVQTLYNIVDTAFVGRLGTEAIAALTFSFPIFFIMIGLNAGISVGMGSRISRFLGAKDKASAENTAIHGIILSFFFAATILVLGLLFLKPLFNVVGAEGNVLKLSLDYMNIILLGVFFMFPAFVINSIFSSQGDTKVPMIAQVIGLILNIILDPILIYIFGWGVKGAAIATILSMGVSLIVYIYFLHYRSYLHIHMKNFRFSPKLVREIIFVGTPASLMMMLMSSYFLIINYFMAKFGTEYIAVLGIISRLESVVIMPIIAGSMALMTLVGMFYGAKRIDLVKNIVWYSIKVGLLLTTATSIILFLFPSLFLKIFTNDNSLISLGIPYVRLELFVFPFIVITVIISRAMQGMGHGIPSLIVILLRVLFVSVPLTYLFVNVLEYGYLSVPVAMIFGSLVASIVAIIWFEIELKHVSTN